MLKIKGEDLQRKLLIVNSSINTSQQNQAQLRYIQQLYLTNSDIKNQLDVSESNNRFWTRIRCINSRINSSQHVTEAEQQKTSDAKAISKNKHQQQHQQQYQHITVHNSFVTPNSNTLGNCSRLTVISEIRINSQNRSIGSVAKSMKQQQQYQHFAAISSPVYIRNEDRS